MTDNGAKALAERLHEVEGCVCSPLEDAEIADAILADDARFLTAEEAERVEQLRTRLGDCDEALTTVEVAYSRRDDEIERLRRIETAARSMFAVESGVCVECGWVGSHGDNPDRFAKECLTLPLRAALTEPSREAVQ